MIAPVQADKRYPTLDGWRGISILLVLAAHLLPLGPGNWQLNHAAGATGMVLFFNLSGFLITSILLRDRDVVSFLIRRFARVVPLAWIFLAIFLWGTSAAPEIFFRSFLFISNWEPMALTRFTSHFWSLCVEMQFYVLVATLVFLFKEKAFLLLPLLALLITLYRFANGVEIAINTYYRLDEILAGCILALLFNRYHDEVKKFFCWLNPFFLVFFVILASHPGGQELQFLRPYLAALLIGSTLFNKERTWCNGILNGRFLFYIASISYALYIIHGGLRHTWLGSGDDIVRYLKRPLLFFVTFALAHLSTFYFEAYWIRIGKKISSKRRKFSYPLSS